MLMLVSKHVFVISHTDAGKFGNSPNCDAIESQKFATNLAKWESQQIKNKLNQMKN